MPDLQRHSGDVLRRVGEAAAEANAEPEHRIPLSPHRGSLAVMQAGGDLRLVAEHLRHDVGDFVVAQHIPFGESAHHRRTDGVDHPADPGLADRKRTHRARLDVGIDRAVGQIAAAENPLGLRYGQDLGMPGDIGVLHDAIDRFGDDLAVAADDAGEWQLPAPHRVRGQLDAAPHHLQIDRRPIHRAQPAPDTQGAILTEKSRDATAATWFADALNSGLCSFRGRLQAVFFRGPGLAHQRRLEQHRRAHGAHQRQRQQLAHAGGSRMA